ncbi:cytochrome b/b6 domain-containing protein [Yoonia sp. 208BN28-4]|uniref:cytochrome b/b6 domain-containing protein n=1 Tax=Yoonia sp. 208BN28-4 TaxID=3126505 RepID=UPI00309E7A67
MASRNTITSYGSVTKVFHWLTALLIIAIIPLGAVANRLPYETSEQLAFKAQIFSWHKTLGVLVFFVALLRILWAIGQSKPGHLHPERKAETYLANVIHWALYISLVIVPLSGWIEHAATTGFAPIWWPFGQTLPFVPQNETLAHTFASLHWIFGKVMVASLLLHIAGALKHHIVDKDATLRRMWFGKADAPAVQAHRASYAAPISAIVVFAAATGAGAMAGFFDEKETAQIVALETVQSDWTVQDGEIAITVKQLGSDVTGRFENWTAAIVFDPDSGTGNVETTIAIGSLTLGSVTEQAMGADFFDVAQYETAVFAADITPADTGYLADGTLTLKGETVPVSLPFTLEIADDTATMAGQMTLDRTAFKIGESMADEGSLGFGVQIDVTLTATQP